eukprot:TRINITY_DN15402_c0_g1_i1.p1 TRINITY_DN15402_c0_g1~~TRINITY_DN15402_c0_g1_i1.p1  ORF type:complete len:219 (-),score=48.54 TRINITY_DN15402_c0_g1_i1:68-724(-)
MSSIKLFYFPISPPARVVNFFAAASGINVEIHGVDLTKGEQKSAEFLAINPTGKVPAIDDNGFHLNESQAIARYLGQKFNSSLFPTDPQQRAKVDAANETILQLAFTPSGMLTYYKAFAARFGKTIEPATITAQEETVKANLSQVSELFFKDSPNFVVGTSLTIADITLGTILAQITTVIAYDLSPFAPLQTYFNNLKKNEAFIKSHESFFTLAKNFQ